MFIMLDINFDVTLERKRKSRGRKEIIINYDTKTKHITLLMNMSFVLKYCRCNSRLARLSLARTKSNQTKVIV